MGFDGYDDRYTGAVFEIFQDLEGTDIDSYINHVIGTQVTTWPT